VSVNGPYLPVLYLQCGVRIGMKLDQDPEHNTCQFLESLAWRGGLAASGNGCTTAGKSIQRLDMSVIRDVVGPGQAAALLARRRRLPVLPPVDRLRCRRCHHQYNSNGNGE